MASNRNPAARSPQARLLELRHDHASVGAEPPPEEDAAFGVMLDELPRWAEVHRQETAPVPVK
ncbi:hypothetical protein WKW80_31630 [Variovorax humicola]|uniref:Uncharacterized protein n=1 Tax=Variovorax humicola TaxID=1769758 RepID=A0ABU8W996_9BURK